MLSLENLSIGVPNTCVREPEIGIHAIMKGTKVQTLGGVAGVWPVAWVRGTIIRMHTAK